MSCRILRKFIELTEHYKQSSSFTLSNGYIRISGVKLIGIHMFVHPNDPIKNDIFLFYRFRDVVQTYSGILAGDAININDMSLSDEELVLIYGKSILDKEVIVHLNEKIDVSLPEFCRFLEDE